MKKIKFKKNDWKAVEKEFKNWEEYKTYLIEESKDNLPKWGQFILGLSLIALAVFVFQNSLNIIISLATLIFGLIVLYGVFFGKNVKDLTDEEFQQLFENRKKFIEELKDFSGEI